MTTKLGARSCQEDVCTLPSISRDRIINYLNIHTVAWKDVSAKNLLSKMTEFQRCGHSLE